MADVAAEPPDGEPPAGEDVPAGEPPAGEPPAGEPQAEVPEVPAVAAPVALGAPAEAHAAGDGDEAPRAAGAAAAAAPEPPRPPSAAVLGKPGDVDASADPGTGAGELAESPDPPVDPGSRRSGRSGGAVSPGAGGVAGDAGVVASRADDEAATGDEDHGAGASELLRLSSDEESGADAPRPSGARRGCMHWLLSSPPKAPEDAEDVSIAELFLRARFALVAVPEEERATGAGISRPSSRPSGGAPAAGTPSRGGPSKSPSGSPDRARSSVDSPAGADSGSPSGRPRSNSGAGAAGSPSKASNSGAEGGEGASNRGSPSKRSERGGADAAAPARAGRGAAGLSLDADALESKTGGSRCTGDEAVRMALQAINVSRRGRSGCQELQWPPLMRIWLRTAVIVAVSAVLLVAARSSVKVMAQEDGLLVASGASAFAREPVVATVAAFERYSLAQLASLPVDRLADVRDVTFVQSGAWHCLRVAAVTRLSATSVQLELRDGSAVRVSGKSVSLRLGDAISADWQPLSSASVTYGDTSVAASALVQVSSRIASSR
eukprot:TRINITY_DN20903_c0_g2_i3.p2 TRINITY_DN20903_c0_g2~~TRINITY_DN20903_c0_g2_i3.p2  ORF type:complete len:550 (-),score=138.52 TRINITY_DN20903_c0_g2_i3:103-1752(-)